MARPIAEIVADMVSPHGCEFDHHGGCQMHGYLDLEPGELCPQAEAKQWLAEQGERQETTEQTGGNPIRFAVYAKDEDYYYVEEADGRVFALDACGFLRKNGLPVGEGVTTYTPE